MAGGSVDVRGFQKLRKSLRAAGDDLSDLRETNRQVAAIAAEGARSEVPVRSGRLKANIRSSGTKTAAIVRAGNNSNLKYAGPVHWGWKARHITAQPFASKGAQRTEPAWQVLYQEAIDASLDKIKGV